MLIHEKYDFRYFFLLILLTQIIIYNNLHTISLNCNILIEKFHPFLLQELGIQPYRRVAEVERFFDIIYNVHVGLGGRSGRHAGQKRTYRTVRTAPRLILNNIKSI